MFIITLSIQLPVNSPVNSHTWAVSSEIGGFNQTTWQKKIKYRNLNFHTQAETLESGSTVCKSKEPNNKIRSQKWMAFVISKSKILAKGSSVQQIPGVEGSPMKGSVGLQKSRPAKITGQTTLIFNHSICTRLNIQWVRQMPHLKSFSRTPFLSGQQNASPEFQRIQSFSSSYSSPPSQIHKLDKTHLQRAAQEAGIPTGSSQCLKATKLKLFREMLMPCLDLHLVSWFLNMRAIEELP